MIRFQRITIFAGIVVGLVAGASAVAADTDAGAGAKLRSLQQTPDAVKQLSFSKPSEKPQWYKNQVAAEKAAAQEPAKPSTPSAASKIVRYTVSINGTTGSSLEQFAAKAKQTFSDSRGWSQLGISFQRVAANGDFNLILSQAALVPTYSSGCSADWSCRVGTSVIVNDDRWQGATAAWFGGGGNLSDYRHYVVNHEVGHWLGHGHYDCSGVGQEAPVMLQQSINMQGCKVNPWPLTNELWTSR